MLTNYAAITGKRALLAIAAAIAGGTGAMIFAGLFVVQHLRQMQGDAAGAAGPPYVEGMIWLAVTVASVGLAWAILLLGTRGLFSLWQADRIRALTLAADQARSLASQSQEQVLNRIGAEIHDGPIQLLTLMLLKSGASDKGRNGQSTPTAQDLGLQAVTELRNISTDLILPEITGLTLAETLRLAVQRAETITGQSVALILEDLPVQADEALRVCCYRVVQEGLSNAFRHADGHDVSVRAGRDGADLVLTVSDQGRKRESSAPVPLSGSRLGLLGLRNRVALFQGTVTLSPRSAGGSDLVARFPRI